MAIELAAPLSMLGQHIKGQSVAQRSTVALWSAGGVRRQPVPKVWCGTGIHGAAHHPSGTMALLCVVFLRSWGHGSTHVIERQSGKPHANGRQHIRSFCQACDGASLV